MKMQDLKKKFHKDNQGSGLIMVLITVGFMSALAAILMFASYGGYKMRNYDKQNKRNFYTAETVIDEINLGLQGVVSESLEVAYTDVMENYALYDNAAQRNNQLFKTYYEEVQKRLQYDTGNANMGKVATLRGYLSDEIKGNGDGTRSNFDTYGAIVEGGTSAPEDKFEMVWDDDKGLLLKDIEVTYVNEENSVAMIDTDIRIVMPEFNFSDGSTFPELNDYCLLSDEAIIVDASKNNAEFTVSGSVCANKLIFNKTAGADPLLKFTPSPSATAEELGLVVLNENMEVKKATVITDQMELWAHNILLNSANARFDGSSYVENDLELAGDETKVTLAGNYIGYGASIGSDKSSAILINGKNSSLDLSELKTLHIGGRAYVGAKGKQFTEDLDPRIKAQHNLDINDNDILMGESIAVKSNQLVYLVPPEVLGCEWGADNKLKASSFNRNPLPADQYEMIINNTDKYSLIDAKKPLERLGGNSLEYYIGNNAPEIVFKHTNAGSLVYCYLNFINEDMANEYLKDYYQLNADSVDKYTRLYLDELKMGAKSSFLHCNLAGNVLAYSADPNQGGSIRLADDLKVNRENMEVELKDVKLGLTKKLLPSSNQLKPAELSNKLFANVIDEIKLDSMMEGRGQVLTLSNAVGDKVIVTKSDYTVNDNAVRIVISTGKVTVNHDFKGAIIAKEGITLTDRAEADGKVELTALTMDEFAQALQAKEGDNYAMQLFTDGSKQFGAGSFGDDIDQVDLVDLIIYEGWNKK